MVRALRNAAVGLGLMLVSASALAENVLQDVRYAAAPGGKVDITLQFSAPVGDVQAFTTDSPPRIAIDLPNTSSGLATRRVVIGSGATKARVRGRSRRAHPRRGRPDAPGRIHHPRRRQHAGHHRRRRRARGDRRQPRSCSAPTPAKRAPATLQVSNIDFRRGDNGAGRDHPALRRRRRRHRHAQRRQAGRDRRQQRLDPREPAPPPRRHRLRHPGASASSRAATPAVPAW